MEYSKVQVCSGTIAGRWKFVFSIHAGSHQKKILSQECGDGAQCSYLNYVQHGTAQNCMGKVVQNLHYLVKNGLWLIYMVLLGPSFDYEGPKKSERHSGNEYWLCLHVLIKECVAPFLAPKPFFYSLNIWPLLMTLQICCLLLSGGMHTAKTNALKMNMEYLKNVCHLHT